uniref:Uncharacterized protein n=1 Tax=Anguilla anguilla TaxID=7936 RepID=A0A0E9VJ75_ANGAN
MRQTAYWHKTKRLTLTSYVLLLFPNYCRKGSTKQ